MGKEKKKQHYVPQCYLEHWAIPNKYQLYVYDKHNQRSYISNIKDVASERYFYDMDFKDIVTDSELKEYLGETYDHRYMDDDQYIENFFAKEVEGDFKERINKIICRVNNMNQWEIENCCFLSKKDKIYLSLHLAFQYLRVKSVRNSMTDTQELLKRWLSDMNASQEVFDRYTVPKSHLPFIHGGMILNKKYLKELIPTFCSLTWILVVNATSHSFFTSDSPIGTIAHIKHPFMPMNGLTSRGVEVYFPLSPKIMLSMIDGDYHDPLSKYDRRIIEVNDIENVKFYNSHALLHCDSRVFSNSNNFVIAEEMIKRNPSVFEQPRTVMHWGEKTYYPTKR